jgi:hypothetical protein
MVFTNISKIFQNTKKKEEEKRRDVKWNISERSIFLFNK